MHSVQQLFAVNQAKFNEEQGWRLGAREQVELTW
jgi:hypothetical protein